MLHNKKHKLTLVIASLFIFFVGVFGAAALAAPAFADPVKVNNTEGGAGQYTCGSGDNAVKVSINFGCKGQGNATTDAAFAIIRVLSAGAGLVVIGSIVLAGVQYTTSRGDPNATSKAVGRIRNSLYALLIYIFAAAMLNFVIPAGFFK
ncbi:MAG TPA: hypothetical protein VJR27_05025 [Candidatus Saccharimonadales bacterium]|nr:hypothetical protein [Candidatus Saccharimonadales bacterium]